MNGETLFAAVKTAVHVVNRSVMVRTWSALDFQFLMLLGVLKYRKAGQKSHYGKVLELLSFVGLKF